MKINMPARFLSRNVGGNSTYAQNLAQALSAGDHTVQPFGSTEGGARSFITESAFALRRNGGVTHFVGDTGPAWGSRDPAVVTVHGVASRWISTARTPPQERVWRARVAAAIRSADRVITVSDSSANDIEAVFNLERSSITVIPHGLDHMTTSAPDQSLFFPNVPTEYALYLGNIEPRKNLMRLVEAFERPSIRALGVPLVIAGSPAWNFAPILSRIQESSAAIYLGRVSDSERSYLMNHAALFVFPSLYEGFGFPILEAMIMGAPVLTSSRGSLRDLSGPARTIADPDSVDDIEIELLDALADTEWRARMSHDGPLWASEFTWKRSADAHASVYGEVAA